MDSTKTLTLGNQQVRPIALKRSSLKIVEESISAQSGTVSLNSNDLYSNIKTSDASTKIDINTPPRVEDLKTNHVKLVVANGKHSSQVSSSEPDSYLTTLINEYHSSLNREDCDNLSCYRFKLISYRISQTLFDRISNLKKELKTNESKREKELPEERMDKTNLIEIISEKDKRIHELEKLVEDQKRLRRQDATRVEEKAAEIKEWVASRLEKLESQNKQLREDNRKQKESFKTLITRMDSSVGLNTSSRKINQIKDSIQYIDHASPVDTIDLAKSLENRRPYLKQPSTLDKNSNLINRSASNLGLPVANHNIENNLPQKLTSSVRHESPVYDSVTEHIHRSMHLNSDKSQNAEQEYNRAELIPPPPPLHRTDRWEEQLYSLADKTFSQLLTDDLGHTLEGKGPDFEQDKDSGSSRKSSLSLKSDLISIVKPSFTTIDGDNVVDDFDFEKNSKECVQLQSNTLGFRDSVDQSSPYKLNLSRLRKDSLEGGEAADPPMSPNLFNSPARSRSTKDNVLRTQSVRRNFASEKLYDIISADLTKRGFLMKPGALKNHNRWIVLRNFYLYSYKTELEETEKATPNMKFKITPNCQVIPLAHTGESNFPFKICYSDKTLQLIASTAQARDDWIRMLTFAISLSDLDPDSLTKSNSKHEGILTVMRHGHTKRYYGVLVNHILFFLKSFTDPSPVSYVSVKGARIREITDNHDNDVEEQEFLNHKAYLQDCSLAIYPRYTMNTDPVYITSGGQRETDKWFYFLSKESGVDQSYGTSFEKSLTKLMISNSIAAKGAPTSLLFESDNDYGCVWKNHPMLLYSDMPITQPLTSLPNETLRLEAIELFKSILLFTQVPIEPIAIDYHVCLLQNCLGRFLKHPELRNEFFAQLVKQCTYVLHRCNSPKLSYSSSSSSPTEPCSSLNSLSNHSSECQFITDVQLLSSIVNGKSVRLGADLSLSQLNNSREKSNSDAIEDEVPPSQSELLQVMQILAVAVSLNLPKGRMRWWLIDYLNKFADQGTNIGKYALYTLKAIDRTATNGFRDNIPSRMEIMSILLRNPYDHSSPHSLPISFTNGSYVVVEADGSTTVDEFLNSMAKEVDIRHSMVSDFYLFADDPSSQSELHILEPQRKILDVLGWWEQTFRRNNSGHYQNTKAIKLICKKRLVLKTEEGETQQERLLIAHQINQEIVTHRIPLDEALRSELAAIMAQLVYGDFDMSRDSNSVKSMLGRITTCSYSNRSSQSESNQSIKTEGIMDTQIVEHWKQLSGKSAKDCVRVYLNCIRRLKLNQ